MQDTGASHEETAIWFLQNHQDLIDEWLPEEKAQIIKDALGVGNDNEQTNPLIDFPFVLDFDVTAIDRVVRAFSDKFEVFFTAIKNGLNGIIGAIHAVLNLIPW